MLRLSNIFKTYEGNGQKIRALDGISLELPETGMIFLLGKSGSGKTSLLNIIGGLDNADSGTYEFNGENAFEYSEREWDKFRNCKIGFVFQDFNLIENIGVAENIGIAVDIQSGVEDNRIDDILKKLGIFDLKNRKADSLSGGQKQRVAIARAIAKDSSAILADEPTGNLDTVTGLEIYGLLKELSDERLVFVVTHDERAALRFGDRIIKLCDGKIASDISDVQAEYSVVIESDGKTRELSGSRVEILDTCSEMFDGGEEKNFSVKIKKKPEKEIKKQIKATEVKSIKQFGLKNALSFALNFIRSRKGRNLVSVLLFSLTALLLFFSITLSAYHPLTVIREYYDQYPTDVYYLYKNAEYTNNFFVDLSKQIRSGEEFVGDLSSVADGGIVGVKHNAGVTLPDYSYGKNADAYFGYDLKSKNLNGSTPDKGEIVLTDYMLDELDIPREEAIGSVVLFDEDEVVISGYINSGYIEYGLIERLHKNPFDPYANAALEREYAVVYLAEDYYEEEERSSIYLYGNDLTLAPYFSQYIASGMLIYGYNKENFGSIALSHGRLPQNKDEVLISNSFMKRFSDYGTNWGKLENSVITLPDLRDEEYNGYYGELFNLYDYFKAGVKVVGVYDESSAILCGGAQMVVDGDIYSKIIEHYEKYFRYDFFVLNTEEEVSKIVNSANNIGLIFDEAAFSVVYGIKSALTDIMPYVIIVIVILALITVFLNITCISCSIKDNSRTIGILRALGMSRNDTVRIFVSETILICLITLVLLTALSIAGVRIINSIFMLDFVERPFNIMYFDIPIFLISAIFICVVGILSAIFPIISFIKKKPIEVIKSD